MEPASFTASILTLLAAAGATTEFVYNFILDIENIPDDIHSQAIKLRCLHQAFSSLVDVYTSIEATHHCLKSSWTHIFEDTSSCSRLKYMSWRKN
jgi:hypothetical protein